VRGGGHFPFSPEFEKRACAVFCGVLVLKILNFELKIKYHSCVLCSCLSLQSDSFNVQVLKAKNVALKALFAKEYYHLLIITRCSSSGSGLISPFFYFFLLGLLRG
jgi:hypothetical protein